MVMATLGTMTNNFTYICYCDAQLWFHMAMIIGFGHRVIRFGDGW